MILYAGCRTGCCYVAGFVASECAVLLFEKPLIYRNFMTVYISMTTKTTRNSKKI